MLLTFLGSTLALLPGCSRAPELTKDKEPGKPVVGFGFLKPRAIGLAVEGHPWITHLATVDLDRDGLLDIVVCEGRLNQISWVRQSTKGVFVEAVIGGPVQAPVHVEAVDFDQDGDLDLLVAGMGVVFPNNQKIGSVVWLEQTKAGVFENHVIAEKIERVTDVRAIDIDRDGDLDLVVAQFGYEQGRVIWMENLGSGKFAAQTLLMLSGAIHAPAADLNDSRRLALLRCRRERANEPRRGHGGEPD